jgi:hypothetical protein
VITHARFAYAQARLQARHGMRPGEALWLHLAGAGSLAAYLQSARDTPLLPWVEDIEGARSSHAIELALRRRFRGYVDEVAGWLPERSRAVVHWIRRMPDLPALQYLLSGEPVQAWMLEDAGLRPFATQQPAARREALEHSEGAWLARAWQHGEPLYLAWLEYWRQLWPAPRRFRAGLDYLARLLLGYLAQAGGEPAATGETPRRMLASGLGYAFRRYSFEPAAACAHLGLVALDLERLRGELLQRVLFAETAGDRA